MKNSKQKKVYFSPTSKLGFPLVFGREGSEELIKQMLNFIITDKTIETVKILNPVHSISDKTSSTFDLYCECNDDSRVIVEMQQAGKNYFMNRNLAYSSLAILDQAKPRWMYDIQKIYFIGILNYVHFKDWGEYRTEVKLMTNNEERKVVNENYLQIYIEMPKIAEVTAESPLLHKFFTAMRKMSGWTERPAEYSDKELDMLFSAARYDALSPEEQEEITQNMSTEEDYREYYESGVQEARE